MSKTLGERVRQLRLAHSYSQRELADLVGTSAGLVSFIERDKSKPNYKIVEKIALVFDTSTDYLINGVPPQSSELEDLIAILRQSFAKKNLKAPFVHRDETQLENEHKVIVRIAKLNAIDQKIILTILEHFEKF